MSEDGGVVKITKDLGKHELGFYSNYNGMIFKSFKHGDGGMTYFKFLRDHLGYCMDNGLEETVQQGNDGRHTSEK